MGDIAIEGVRDGDLAEILGNFERFWGDRDLPRYLHHPTFFLEFRDTAFVARDLGTGEIAGYLLGFVAPSRKITYIYDLGAGWEHEITLEKTLPLDPRQDYPVCVAFRGDSPVEYWDEEDPEEPEPFVLTEVNRELAALSREAE